MISLSLFLSISDKTRNYYSYDIEHEWNQKGGNQDRRYCHAKEECCMNIRELPNFLQ